MIEFLYKGEKYYAAVLETKLKRMKITVNDIQIIEKPKPQQEVIVKKPYIILWDPATNETYWNRIDEYREFTMDEFMERERELQHIWDPNTKTGIGSYYTEDFIRTLVILKGKPKYPIIIGEDGLP